MDWRFYGAWLAIASVITFILYGFDKAQSKNGGWRVHETVLHGLASIGRIPGRVGGEVGVPAQDQERVLRVCLVVEHSNPPGAGVLAVLSVIHLSTGLTDAGHCLQDQRSPDRNG